MNDNYACTTTKICPICGKVFEAYPEHVYTDKRYNSKGRKVCTYKCQCESERQREKGIYAKSMKVKTTYKCEDGFVGTISEIRKHLNRGYCYVKNRIDKGEIKFEKYIIS